MIKKPLFPLDLRIKAEAQPANTPAFLVGRRVLLAEDDAISREVMVALLSHFGIQVETAENGKQALQLALTGIFDLVLMDVQMAEMDGLTATRLIRANEQLQDLPVIAMTAHVMDSDRQKGLAAGMNDYLTKPVDPKKLQDVLNRWISRKLPLPQTTNQSQASQLKQQEQLITDDLLPASLPPFNIPASLIQMNGDSALLRKLILMFRDDCADTKTQLPKLIAAGNYEAAAHCVHTLKGAALMLNIGELPAIADILGQAIRAGNKGKIKLFLKVLESVLTPAIAAVSRLDAAK